MQIQAINGIKNNSNMNCKTGKPNFGHTFKVSICTYDKDGVATFVNPASKDKNARALYKKLNRKIVSFLNEPFITGLREKVGIPRKVSKVKTPHEAEVQKDLTKKLKDIDSDYKQAPFVRSNYSNEGLGYIATGVDVPIIEDMVSLGGASSIGVAKKGNTPGDKVVREITEQFKKDDREYVKSPVQLLRSKDNKEIMLRANFSDNVSKKGKHSYEMKDFDFHEIQSSNLPPLKPEDKSIKKDIDLNVAVAKFFKRSFKKFYKANEDSLSTKEKVQARRNFNDVVLQKRNIQHDLPVKEEAKKK